MKEFGFENFIVDLNSERSFISPRYRLEQSLTTSIWKFKIDDQNSELVVVSLYHSDIKLEE